mgnify:CR=1 FL=1
MPDLTAGEATSRKAQGGMDFSTAPIPAIRKVLEFVGWGWWRFWLLMVYRLSLLGQAS